MLLYDFSATDRLCSLLQNRLRPDRVEPQAVRSLHAETETHRGMSLSPLTVSAFYDTRASKPLGGVFLCDCEIFTNVPTTTKNNFKPTLSPLYALFSHHVCVCGYLAFITVGPGVVLYISWFYIFHVLPHGHVNE